MNPSLKQYAAWAIRLRDKKIVSDIFASAKIRITLLYFFVGVLILLVAGSIIYNRTIGILNIFTESLSQTIALTSLKGAQQSASTQTGLSGAQQAGQLLSLDLESEVKNMIYTVSAWMILAMLVFSYLLAGITLKPIEQTLKNKKRFIGNVSHELRTPLSIIKTSSESALIDINKTTKEELVDIMKNNLEEIDRMSKTLQFLLAFSVFEHRSSNMDMGPINILDAVRRAIKLVEIPLGRKSMQVNLPENRGIFVRANATALEEVLLNILKNAVRHSPNGGRIKVEIGEESYGTVFISIEDNGSGIAAADLPHIFEPFYRAKGSSDQARSKSNAGLGLAIVKEIVTLHRGTIDVHSVLGKGTKIEVRLPLAMEEPSPTLA